MPHVDLTRQSKGYLRKKLRNRDPLFLMMRMKLLNKNCSVDKIHHVPKQSLHKLLQRNFNPEKFLELTMPNTQLKRRFMTLRLVLLPNILGK